MPETPLYIPTPAGPLFAVLHAPEGGVAAKSAVLMLAPGLDEKRSAHGALARLARALAAAGCIALRFDYRGTGDSAGESAEVTLGAMEEDAAAAAGFLREKAGEAALILLGVRLGASLALRLGAGLGADRVVAVAPVVKGPSWLRQERGKATLRRSMVERELAAAGAGSAATARQPTAALPAGVEDLGGVPASDRLTAELAGLDLLAGLGGAEGPDALIVQISPRKAPLQEIERLAAACRARVECLNLEPFWQPLEHPDIGPLAELVGRLATGGAT